jgi:hypothetical protein
MKRGIDEVDNNNPTLQNLILLNSVLVDRMALATSLGQQSYGGDRDIYEALGYLKNILYTDYLARYKRQDMARAIIDLPVKKTWEGELELEESNAAEDTAFEKAWKTLNTDFRLKSKFSRVDRLSSIGRYGILLFGLDDVKLQDDFAKPVKLGDRKLKYVRPFGEGSATISKHETDTNNPRYGMPLEYSITINNSISSNSNSTGSQQTITVHYSRVLHILNDPLESDIESDPQLEIVFDRLMDVEKIVGGDAEMFWRGARPGYHGKVDKDFQMTPKTKDALKDQIAKFEHNLTRFLINEGVDINALAPQVSDPTSHVDVQVQMISAVKRIPKRILMGSERGELSSGQDADEWNQTIQNRRDEHAEPNIVRPFIQRCIELRILPKPSTGEYKVKWSNLFAKSEKELTEIAKNRTTALKEYSDSMAQSIIPLRAFLEFYQGFSSDQITLIEKMQEDDMTEEQKSINKIPEEDIEEQQKDTTQTIKPTPNE